MPASAVSSPTASTRTRMAESVDTVPATTRSPTSLATGLDSPVIIDSSSSAEPSTISPSAGTRAPERTSTTSPGRRSSIATDSTVAVGPDPLGLVGQQRGQRGEGVLGLAEGPHLLPVAQQHDRDQRGQLPPEVQVERVERGRHRRDVGDGDRHGDQQHHPGLAVLQLPPAALEERPAAPEEDDRPEHRADPLDPGEVELVAEPVHDHVAGRHHRDGQQQAPPEPPPERLGVVPGVLAGRVPPAPVAAWPPPGWWPSGLLRSSPGWAWCGSVAMSASPVLAFMMPRDAARPSGADGARAARRRRAVLPSCRATCLGLLAPILRATVDR